MKSREFWVEQLRKACDLVPDGFVVVGEPFKFEMRSIGRRYGTIGSTSSPFWVVGSDVLVYYDQIHEEVKVINR